MNAFGAELWGAPGSSAGNAHLRIRKTTWGFAVTDTSDRLHSIALEKTLKLLAVAVVPMGSALALTQGIQWSGGFMANGLGLAVASAVIGTGLFGYASRGFGTELRVDAVKREVHLGTINAKGAFKQRLNFPASEAQSFFLLRARTSAPTRLCTRTKKSGQIVKLLKGTEAELVPILERLSEALRPRHLPNKRARTRVTGAFIHAAFV